MPEYIVCHLCGRNRVRKSKTKGSIRWDYADLITSPFIQIRETTGKVRGSSLKRGRGQAPGSGFPTVETRTLPDILNDPECKPIIQGCRDQIVKLARQTIQIGLVDREEI
jgi:hypothetical protein